MESVGWVKRREARSLPSAAPNGWHAAELHACCTRTEPCAVAAVIDVFIVADAS